jgi:hypothetical protein
MLSIILLEIQPIMICAAHPHHHVIAATVPRKLLRTALTELEKRFKVSIVYDSDVVNGKYVSNADYEGESIETSLSKLLKEHGLFFRKAGEGFYYISAKKQQPTSGLADPAAPGHAGLEEIRILEAEKQITGKITDAATGEPLPGVSVVLKGTSTGSVTDETGTFSIAAEPVGGTLVCSCIGYATCEIPIQNQTALIIALQPDIQVLSEAVVVGYGTQERKDITGAVSVIKSGDIEKVPVAGLDQALQGQAAGVFVSANSGAPGSDVTVRIRGTGTIGNNNPLYVIDGTPTGPEALNLFNPRGIKRRRSRHNLWIEGSKRRGVGDDKKRKKRRAESEPGQLLWNANGLASSQVAQCVPICDDRQ